MLSIVWLYVSDSYWQSESSTDPNKEPFLLVFYFSVFGWILLLLLAKLNFASCLYSIRDIWFFGLSILLGPFLTVSFPFLSNYLSCTLFESYNYVDLSKQLTSKYYLMPCDIVDTTLVFCKYSSKSLSSTFSGSYN